ncbi:hypothetical protein SNE95_003410 [Vibrio cholerae]|uniref:hypothetical protein n=1 Tax=Vibrio paracholerae TaxID=650003 RepID=UPI000DE1B648|nr:hypothetical protein [Vibrio paracholerae]ELJ8549544.1 hypothetical protein [Vibrio cholerae]ELY5189448.1 hypothetical protein [Vibrio cholerae]ELY5289358.1 hypothetical protein [Vibrio cholerae]RBM79454.1 hypothetical protein DLR68_04035 [Vibrio paracholerae]
MSTKFNFSGLSPLFNESLERDEQTIAFEVKNGKGSFLFLMFFDKDDSETQDQLFVFLRNTRFMLELKLYGAHKKGQFDVYIKPWQEERIKSELGIGLGHSTTPFDFVHFLTDLNSSFPASLPLTKKIENLRKNWSVIKSDLPKRVIKEEDKTVLIGEKRLPDGQSPSERTLRKLYLHTQGDPNDIERLIKCLKAAKMTVAWTTEDSRFSSTDVRALINRIE